MGTYQVTAKNLVSGQTKMVQVVVDHSPCRIIVDKPQRAAAITGQDGSRIPVEGSIVGPIPSTCRLWIGGKPVAVPANGQFHTAVQAHIGMNVIDLKTQDEAGHRFRLAQSFLMARKYTDGALTSDLSVSLGPAVFRLIASLAAKRIAKFDFAASLPHPTVAEWYASADVRRIVLGAVSTTVRPGPNKSLDMELVVSSPTKILGSVVALGMPKALAFAIVIDSIRIRARYRLSLSQRGPEFVLTSKSVALGPMERELQWLPDSLIPDMKDRIEQAMTSALKTTIPARLDAMMRHVTTQLSDIRTGPKSLIGPLTLAVRLTGIKGLGQGMVLDAQVTVGQEPAHALRTFPGMPVRTSSPHREAHSAKGIALWLDEAGLNKLLYSLWIAGRFRAEFTLGTSHFAIPIPLPRGGFLTFLKPILDGLSEKLGLDPRNGRWDLSLPDIRAELALDSLLPPVARIQNRAVHVSFGDTQAHLYLSSSWGSMTIMAYVSGSVLFTQHSDRNGARFSLSVERLVTDVDTVIPNALNPEKLEPFVDAFLRNADTLLTLIAPRLSDRLMLGRLPGMTWKMDGTQLGIVGVIQARGLKLRIDHGAVGLEAAIGMKNLHKGVSQ